MIMRTGILAMTTITMDWDCPIEFQGLGNSVFPENYPYLKKTRIIDFTRLSQNDFTIKRKNKSQ